MSWKLFSYHYFTDFRGYIIYFMQSLVLPFLFLCLLQIISLIRSPICFTTTPTKRTKVLLCWLCSFWFLTCNFLFLFQQSALFHSTFVRIFKSTSFLSIILNVTIFSFPKKLFLLIFETCFFFHCSRFLSIISLISFCFSFFFFYSFQKQKRK